MKLDLDDTLKKANQTYESRVVVDKETIKKEINLAIDHGYERLEKKQHQKDNVIFVLIAILVFAMAGTAIQLGFGLLLIGIQLILVIGVPLLIPYTISSYVKGGLK
jgi:hypothetical protein